jgi:arylsulfatase A-like enzyme
MLRTLLAAGLLLFVNSPARSQSPEKPRRPNVVVIIADDMGHGDLGFHGNPKISTPHLDRFARQSVRMKYFYVSPVCSPTRASLLTGRYNYRTGVVDTFIGRSMMYPDEVTLAEMLAAGGYRTGIFGKWHLGDCCPMRPIDQGFHEALVHRGGGIGQPSDPPGGSSYFDPILQHNGKQVQKKGYCSDVFADAAIDFITHNKDRPFFCYLAFNAPHTPLQVPDNYYQKYKKMNLAHDQFPQVGHPLPPKANHDDTAKVYGMVENIDDNVGRLLAKLAELKLDENTIVIFLTDNGPQQVRYNSGMLMRKGNVHEGGVRVPFFIRWPGGFRGDRDLDRIAAHIDVTPTLLELCEVQKPAKVRFDGVSLVPLLKTDKVDWPERTLYFQWHRGDVPELYRAFAARSQKWRLVQPEGVQPGKDKKQKPWTFKLYDMEKDPLEKHNVAAEHPEVVAKMKKGYEEWFKDVSSTRGYDPPRIVIGSDKENPTVLTRQDWRGPAAGWTPMSVGSWEVNIIGGAYDITLELPEPTKGGGHVYLSLTSGAAAKGWKKELAPGAKVVRFLNVALRGRPARLEASFSDGENDLGMLFVTVQRVK